MANILDKINKIRTAILGKEVRSSLADGLEAINNEVEATTSNQNNLKQEFDALIDTAGNSLGDLNNSINNGNILKDELNSWKEENQDITDLNETVSGHTAELEEHSSQLVENTNSIENILQELINCIKKDGSIPFETGQDKGVKIGEIARITVEGSNILIYNKSNGLHSIQLTNDGHFLLSEGGKIGSGNYPVSELWLGERSITENGYSKLPNGLIIQWGRGMVNESNSGVYHFPIAFPNDCLAIGLSGSWNSTRDYFLRMGRVSKSTYGQYSSSVEYNEVSWMAIGY